MTSDLDEAIDRERARLDHGAGHLVSHWLARFALQRSAGRFVG